MIRRRGACSFAGQAFSAISHHTLSKRHLSTEEASAGTKTSAGASLRTAASSDPLFGATSCYQGRTRYERTAVSSSDDGHLTKIPHEFLNKVKFFGMPRGYPTAVADGYGRFFYQYVAGAFLGNFAMSIATQALLGGFFTESTPQVWMIKDLAPSVFAAYLANRVASYELRPKYWILVAAVLSQGASFADLWIPQLIAPQHYLAAAILSAIVKHNSVLMHFVARASVLQHFATHQNLGEIQKKLNSFGMVSFTIATALGILYTTFFPSFAAHVAAVTAASCANIVLSYTSLSHLSFRVLTPITAQVTIEHYIRSHYTAIPTTTAVQDRLGLRAVLPDNAYVEQFFAVNPPLASVRITAAGALLCRAHTFFTVGVWDVTSAKQAASTRRWLPRSPAPEEPPGAHPRLVLLVHRHCPPEMLLFAHCLCLAALDSARHLKAGSAAWHDALRAFMQPLLAVDFAHFATAVAAEALRLSSADNDAAAPAKAPPEAAVCLRELWLARAARLVALLGQQGWDVRTPAMDPLDLRISTTPE